MEKIKINSIEKKGVVCIIKYIAMMDENPRPEKEATLNINFNSQEISYLENDVGIGGTVDVEIKHKEKQPGIPKEGYWVNITKVDFGSAVPSGQVLKEVQNGERSLNGQKQMTKQDEIVLKGLYGSSKDKSIIAQCLVKAVIGTWGGKGLEIPEAVEMYKKALELLNGK